MWSTSTALISKAAISAIWDEQQALCRQNPRPVPRPLENPRAL